MRISLSPLSSYITGFPITDTVGRYITIFLFSVIHLPIHGSSIGQPIPAGMKYFEESKRIEANDDVVNRIDSLAKELNLKIYRKPALLSVDFAITDAKLEKAILISLNRRTNPEYQNKVYQHGKGQIFQLNLHGQQVSLFLWNFNEKDYSKIYFFFKPSVSSKILTLLLNEAQAGETVRSSNGQLATPLNYKTQESETFSALAESFKGCGSGLVETLTAPGKAIESFAHGAVGVSHGVRRGFKNVSTNPAVWWGETVEDFAALGRRAAGFPEYLANRWDELSPSKALAKFNKKTTAEQSKFWCEYFSPSIGSSVVGLAAKKKVAKLPDFGKALLPAAASPYPKLDAQITKMKITLGNSMQSSRIKEFSDPKGPFTLFDATVEPGLLRNATDVYNRLHSPDEITAWMEKVMKAAADDILKRKIPKEVDELVKSGSVSRNAVLRVLVQRAKDRGETFSSLKGMGQKQFNEIVAKGPFFDKGLKSIEHPLADLHGIDSHLIQRDMVADVFQSPAQRNDFFRSLSETQTGQDIWSTIFDASPRAAKSLSSPAGITTQLKPYLNNN